ncbi:hypothetical protein WAI453_005222 [Rhynchosporium graminicola]
METFIPAIPGFDSNSASASDVQIPCVAGPSRLAMNKFALAPKQDSSFLPSETKTRIYGMTLPRIKYQGTQFICTTARTILQYYIVHGTLFNPRRATRTVYSVAEKWRAYKHISHTLLGYQSKASSLMLAYSLNHRECDFSGTLSAVIIGSPP